MYSFLVILSTLILCDSITIRDEHQDIVTKSKIELKPVFISCEFNDIIILSAPVVNSKEVQYELNKPNGDIRRLEFNKRKSNHSRPRSVHENEKFKFSDYNDMIIKYIGRDVKTIYNKRNYKIIKASFGFVKKYGEGDIIEDEEDSMKENDFMIGPLLEEDHGNWVLSVYCKDLDDNWIEMFQMITIEIIVTVPMKEWMVQLNEGDTFNLSFAYPIKGLVTCELTAPMSTFDRYFDRNRIELDVCGYVVTNVTRQDEGTWRVIGVGKVVYEGIVNLSVESFYGGY